MHSPTSAATSSDPGSVPGSTSRRSHAGAPLRRTRPAAIRISPRARAELQNVLTTHGLTAASVSSGSVLWVRPDDCEPLLIASCDDAEIPEGFEVADAWGIPVLLRSTERERIRAMRIEYVEGPTGGFMLDRTPPVTGDAKSEAAALSGACTSCSSASLPGGLSTELSTQFEFASGATAPDTSGTQPHTGRRRGPSLPVVSWTSR